MEESKEKESLANNRPRRIIEVVDRATGTIFHEKVYGQSFMEFCYGSATGLWLTSRLLAKRTLSYLYGIYNDSVLSRHKVAKFVKEFDVAIEECADAPATHRSFNDFFARHLKPEARPVDSQPHTVISPGDGRLLVFPHLDGDTLSYVKWAPVRLLDIFGADRDLAQRYKGGSCAILRLCPTDYHRFHFPVGGIASSSRVIDGLLHSVSPYALEQKIPVFAVNRRALCEVATDNLGKVLLIEVGALCVGGIVQTHPVWQPVHKGEEKGYFKFGGSTCILFFEPESIIFDNDLIENSKKNIETYVKMGERIAVAKD